MLRAHPFTSPPPVRLVALVAVLGLLAGEGCTRPYYRNQADIIGGGLMREFGRETRQPAVDTAWRPPAPESRLFDPLDPDFPPMPPDDPTAHSRLHRVDGMRAYDWHKYGETPVVDDGHWLAFLPYDEAGNIVLDMQSSVQLAYLHSREFRKELEDLYMSALDVAFERFRFAAQFFGGDDVHYISDGRLRSGSGGDSSSELTNDANLRVDKLYAAGGQMVVDLANSIVWQFSGPNSTVNTTLLDFTFVQPLLRLGGRARVLERLTLVERQLIYNVRQMEQYRQGFFAQVVTGRAPGDGPNRRGGVSGAGLQGFAGFGGGFGRINVATTSASGVVGAGGFLGLLQDQIQIQNQEANVTTLRDSLTRLQDEFDADRIKDKFQVELARQALYEAQSRLLASKAAFQTELDTFKVFLGLPPQLNFTVDDPLLRQFQLLDPAMSKLTERAGQIALRTHRAGKALTVADLDELLDADDGIRPAVMRHFEIVEADFARLEKNLPQRIRQLEALNERAEVQSGEVDRAAYSVAALEERRNTLRRDLDGLKKGLEDTWEQLARLRNDLPNMTPQQARERLDEIHPVLSSQLLALSLAQARARVDAIVWTPIDVTWQEALETARWNRRDWMNARAALVDTWRLIEYNANALKSGLNLVFSGDLSTVNDNPVKFRDTTGRLRAGLEFDAPLTRVAERNIYRQSLIEYQQARRGYMQFEDRVCQSLRNIIRTVQLNQLNFEIRRSAVQVAIQQVDLARETLARPLKPGELAADYAAARASIGRDLVTALGSLLDGQNNFIAVWVSYEVQRVSLDLEMGTMQLDDRGMWIDPGPMRGSDYVDWVRNQDTPAEELPDLIEPEALPAPANNPIGPRIVPVPRP